MQLKQRETRSATHADKSLPHCMDIKISCPCIQISQEHAVCGQLSAAV